MNAYSIHYTLSFCEPQAHYMEVQMIIKNLKNSTSKSIDVKMPVWTPGSYLVREYSRHVESFQVSNVNKKQKVSFQKTNKNTWRIFNDGKDLCISYRLYGFEKTVRTNFFDEDHAFVSPASTFLYIDGHKNLSSTIEVIPAPNWTKISTGLPTVKNQPNIFFAKDVDTLIDSPIEIGNQETWTFEVENTLHEFAMVGGGNYNTEELTKDVSKIIRTTNKIWPENPNERYVFITHHYKSAYGGLEHCNSTVLATSRNGYNKPSTYQKYLGLVAHEYFHLWCVKRLRPKELGPFDYDKENYSKALWVMEGFTSYYDNLILRRAGVLNETEYLSLLSRDFNAVYLRPGVKVQSAEMSSFDTWIKHYRPDENTINSQVSYYNKGALLACALDLKIITETNGGKRLDQVLREAYMHFYMNLNRGFELEELQQLAQEITGVDLSEIFNAASLCEELDYISLFQKVGYSLKDHNKESQKTSLGIDLRTCEQRLYVKSVKRDSAAWKNGLNVHDEIIAINEERVDTTENGINSFVEECPAGEVLHILIAREGRIRQIDIQPQKDTQPKYKITPIKNRTSEQARLGDIWLSL